MGWVAQSPGCGCPQRTHVSSISMGNMTGLGVASAGYLTQRRGRDRTAVPLPFPW